MSSGWYELKKAKDGQFHFNLKSGNGETVLSSELYKTRASAENGIASVQKNCMEEKRFAPGVSANGQFYFTLKAGNNEVIGQSEMYGSESARDRGIRSVKENGISKMIKDLAG